MMNTDFHYQCIEIENVDNVDNVDNVEKVNEVDMPHHFVKLDM